MWNAHELGEAFSKARLRACCERGGWVPAGIGLPGPLGRATGGARKAPEAAKACRAYTRMIPPPAQEARARCMAPTRGCLPEEVPAPEVEELSGTKRDAKIEDIVHLMQIHLEKFLDAAQSLVQCVAVDVESIRSFMRA